MALSNSNGNHEFGELESDAEEELAEVDLDSFNYTDDMHDWIPSAVPVIPQK